MIMQFWTAVSSQKKIYNQFFVRKLRLQQQHRKALKSAGVDNIPVELVQADGKTIIDVLTEICDKIWRAGE